MLIVFRVNDPNDTTAEVRGLEPFHPFHCDAVKARWAAIFLSFGCVLSPLQVAGDLRPRQSLAKSPRRTDHQSLIPRATVFLQTQVAGESRVKGPFHPTLAGYSRFEPHDIPGLRSIGDRLRGVGGGNEFRAVFLKPRIQRQVVPLQV